MITAKLTAYAADGSVSHQDTREYPHTSLLWEHIGTQQHNRKTVRVHVETETGLRYKVEFSPWTRQRRYSPSRRFQALLQKWSAESAGTVAGQFRLLGSP
jgi:hypothetical protein